MKPDELKSSLGNAIKKTRAELCLSQEELADRAELHRTYISDVERGARNPSIRSIEKLASALQVSVATLFARAASAGTVDPLVEILLVEDDPADVELTLRAFRKARITNVVHVVRDGREALDFVFATGAHVRRLNQPRPGVILLDLNLPKIDGLEVLRQIKADESMKGIPVVVLTGSNEDRDIATCRRLGAANYIVKPVGLQNFSEVTPHLGLEWTLRKTSPGGVSGATGHEDKPA